jgi:hypothetical protein
MEATAGSMPTIGMRLDAMIARIDNLPSTQLYGIIVAVTVVLCVVLLGTGNSNLDLQKSTHASKDDLVKKSSPPSSVPKGRQPRWHIFKWVNYLAVAAFLWSVCTFCLNASHYLHHESQGVLVQFLVGWSVFLLYFFGFFGVSLIHEDIAGGAPTSNEELRYIRS